MKRTGEIVGSWLLLEFLYSRRGRHYWQAECLNCKIRKKMEESNMKPPAGGKCQHCWGRPRGYSGFREVVDSYKRNALKFHRALLLSEVDFRELTQQCCHYCGQPPSLIRKTRTKSSWGDYCYNGLDRKDNSLGYTKENCLPCCNVCNRAKRDMTYSDFIEYINRIKLFRD